MNTPITQGADTTAYPFSAPTQPTFYQLSWENWTDSEGSFHKKLIGKLHQIKLSEDGEAISEQGFFLAGKDEGGHDLFIARELSDPGAAAPTTFSANYRSVLSAAGEYHPVDITDCGRMIDLDGKEKTVTSAFQVLVAKSVSLDSAQSAEGLYALQWIDWDASYPISQGQQFFRLGITSENLPIYTCRGLVDASNPDGGYAIGTYLAGDPAAHIPFKGDAPERTSFQLLQAIPLTAYLSKGFSMPQAQASTTASSSSHPVLTQGSAPAGTRQHMRNYMGALMSEVVYQATGYKPTASDPDTPTTSVLTPYTTTYVGGQEYTLHFSFVDAQTVELTSIFDESISPDRYVLFKSVSKPKLGNKTPSNYMQGNIYLGFGGTHTGDTVQTVTDWLLNGMINQVPYPMNSLNAKAHCGFMLAMASCAGIDGVEDGNFAFSLENPLFKTINKQVEDFIDYGYQQVNLYVGGHSQGGAVATLMAPLLKSLLLEAHGSKIEICTEVYTYGAPRACNSALAVNYMDMVDACYRYQNEGDPVPFVPPGKYGLLAAAFNADAFIEQFLGEHISDSDLEGILGKYAQLMQEVRTKAADIDLNPSLQEVVALLKSLVIQAAQAVPGAAKAAAKAAATTAQAALDAINELPDTLQNVWKGIQAAWAFLKEKVFTPIGKFLGNHPFAQSFKAVMTQVEALINALSELPTTILPAILFILPVPVYVILTVVQSIIETFNNITGLNLPDLSTYIGNMEAVFKEMYGSLGASVTDVLAFFYSVSHQDYAHVGRLQTVIGTEVEDGTGDVMFSSNFFSSLYSKNEHLAFSKLSFDQHSMKTYVANLAALLQQ